jgi:hypothetical protein
MANKKNISVRLGLGDLRRVKEIALRLNVKESDIFRFAVKSLSTRLMPLINRQLSGVPMLIALLEGGEELLRYFEFDAYQLDHLINGGEGGDRAVAEEDVELLAIGIINVEFLADNLSRRLGIRVEPGHAFASLHEYLLNKYQDGHTRDVHSLFEMV